MAKIPHPALSPRPMRGEGGRRSGEGVQPQFPNAHHFQSHLRPPSDWSLNNYLMKSLTEYLWFEVPDRRGFINITDTIEKLVRKSGVREGLCLVNAMHITASVFINDAEEGLLHDFDVWLEQLAPHEPVDQYHHSRTGE